MITRIAPMATAQRTNFRGFGKNDGNQLQTDLQRSMSKANNEKWKRIEAEKAKTTELLETQMKIAEKNLSEHLGVAPHKLHFPYR